MADKIVCSPTAREASRTEDRNVIRHRIIINTRQVYETRDEVSQVLMNLPGVEKIAITVDTRYIRVVVFGGDRSTIERLFKSRGFDYRFITSEV